MACGTGEGGPVFAYGSAEVCAALRDFWQWVAAFLIENLTQIMEFLDAGSEVCGLCWGGDRKYISICVYTNILH